MAHPDARRRLAAAWVLGDRREKRAVAALGRLAAFEKQDAYLAKAAVVALAKIGGPEANAAVRSAANHHPARLVRQAAQQALRQIFSDK